MEHTNINIFDYATSELSQDAFLCWTIRHLSYNCEVGRFANSLMKLINTRCTPCFDEDWSNYQAIEILKQKKFINETEEKVKRVQSIYVDIFVEFRHKEKDKSFILLIEDKKWSEENGHEQLISYVKIIEKNAKYKNMTIYPVYLKTGYISFEEYENIKNQNIILIDQEDIYSIVKDLECENIILKYWVDNFGEIINIKRMTKKVFDSWYSSEHPYPSGFMHLFNNLSYDKYYLVDLLRDEVEKGLKNNKDVSVMSKNIKSFISNDRTLHIALFETYPPSKSWGFYAGLYLMLGDETFYLCFKTHISYNGYYIPRSTAENINKEEYNKIREKRQEFNIKIKNMPEFKEWKKTNYELMILSKQSNRLSSALDFIKSNADDIKLLQKISAETLIDSKSCNIF